MSQDPYTVPYQRASYEQNPHQAAPYGQPFTPRPAYREPAGGRRPLAQPAPEWQHPHGPAYRGGWQETLPRDQSPRPAWSAQPDPEAALAACQKAERKATLRIAGSVLCVVGSAVIILYAAVTHHMDTDIETAGPVFMLLGLANFRRLVKLRTRCRTAAERLTHAA
jgi:hypothetical protein